jgi:cephalosporin-C deacetylase-like acetyl esterase
MVTLASRGLTPAGETQVPAAPTEAVKAVSVSADRLDGLYKVGEKVVFAVQTANCPTDAVFDYTVTLDTRRANTTIKSGKAQSGETVEVNPEEASFVSITVRGHGLTATAAAGVSPREIRFSRPRPADFRAYWKKKLAELATVPLNVQIKPLEQPTPADYASWSSRWAVFGDFPYRFNDIDLFEVTADALGNPARGYLTMPRGAAPRSLPAVLFTHGAGMADADKLKPCAAARLGFLAMDINGHGLLVGQPPEYYKQQTDDAQQKYGGIFKKGRLNKDELYLAEMYLRHRRALDVLRARPEWDGKHLLVRGASMGGALALACAGLDTNVTAICVGVPAFCDNAGQNTLPCFFVDQKDDAGTVEKVRDAVRYVSVGYFGPEARAEAYFAVAFLDTACHPASVYAAYNAYAGPKRIFNGPVADHGGIPRSINYDDFTRFMLEHVAPKR